MSNRDRNHHTPRLLLNRFASKVDEEKAWVWQISRDASAKELSTRDVAVSRGFYGKRPDGVEDALAVAETRFGAALAGIDAGQSPDVFADDLRHFVWTTAARTRAIREQSTAAFNDLMLELGKWSNTTEAALWIRARIDEEIQNVIQQLPPQLQQRARTYIQAPANRKAVLDHAESNFSGLAGILTNMIKSQGLAAKSAKTGQVRALGNLLEAGTAPDTFRPAAWHLVSRSRGQVVLGDACVVAMARDASLCSLIKAGKDWHEAYLPISSRLVPVATRGHGQPSLVGDAINQASAAFAQRYIYASRTGPDIDELKSMVGTGNPLISPDELAEAVRGTGNERMGTDQ